jgi:tetratricopeptide (TPR) repeat protein
MELNGNESGAEAEYKKALRKNPYYAGAFNGLARLLLSKNSGRRSLENCEKAIAQLLKSENLEETVESSHLLAQAFSKVNDFEESTRWLNETLNRSSRESSFNINLIPIHILNKN